MYFRNLIFSAFSIALLAGLFFTLYQMYFITPIILASEAYEVAELVDNTHTEAWRPHEGAERSGYSFIANVLLCFAYGLLLMTVMLTAPATVKIKHGFFWGGAAYISLFVAPSLGLSPEIPGMEAAELVGRQSWWLLTVLLTALGLWSLFFETLTLKLTGVIMLILPHLLGAPHPENPGFTNTDPQAISALTNLWHDFIIQTSIANALLWLIIGALSAFLTNKFIYPLDYQKQE